MADPWTVAEAELDAVVTWNAARVGRFLGQRLAERLAAQGLHPIHFGVLTHLAAGSQVSQADLARAVQQRPQSVASLLDGMERRGLVRRTGDRARGRRNPLEVTDEGRRALEAAWSVARESNDLTDVGLTAAEGVELNRLLLKVVTATGGARSDNAEWEWRERPEPTERR